MEDPEPEMVHVDIVDTREGVTDSQSLSTLQQVDLTTTAKNLCDAMEGKMDLSYDDSKHYTLVLVISYAISSRGSSRDSGTHTHYIHTFAPEDNIKATVATCMSSFCQKHHLPCQPAIINLTSSTLPSSIKIRFFYKSYLHYPLDIEPGDQSGSDSDEESTQVGLSDLAYLRHGADKRGFLLKRSKRDANLWRKRYCVLTDKLYILNAKKLIPTGVVAQLSGSMKLHLDAGLLDFPFIIRLEGRGEDQSWLLRAGGLQDHGEWCDVLLSKITLARENEVIKLAEVMICDEEKRKVDRLHKALDNSVFSTLGGNDALTSLVLPLSSEGGNLNCNSSRVASTGSTTSSASSTPSGNGSSKSANDADSGSGRSHDSRDSGREKERKKSLLSLSTTPIFSIRANINASTVVAATPTTSMDMVGKMQKEYNSSGAISQLTPTTSTIMSNKNQTPENSSILTQELHSNGPGESNQSHFNTEPINEQTSSRMEHLSKLLPRTEPSSEPLPKQRSHRRPLILHALLSQQDRDVWRAYCFIHDVSIYKEFFRMEVSVSDARIWREVCFVYDKHLAEYETVCLSSNDGKNAHRWKFSEASLQKVRSYMFKRIRPKTSQELHYQTLQVSNFGYIYYFHSVINAIHINIRCQCKKVTIDPLILIRSQLLAAFITSLWIPIDVKKHHSPPLVLWTDSGLQGEGFGHGPPDHRHLRAQ